MKLRVALVALYPVPGANAPGGVRAVAQNLVRGLRAYDDLELHVIHCHADIRASATVVDGNVTLHYLAMPRWRVVPNTLSSIRRVENMLRQVQRDVISAHAAHYTVAALHTGVPTLFTIHGVLEREAEVYQSTWFDRSRFALETWLERRALRGVRDVVAISPYVLDEYQGRSAARFHRIDNPLPPEFFTVPNQEEDGRLLYAGTIDERKNVLDLLRALAIIRQTAGAKLRIAGRSTQRDYERKVREFVVAQGLQANVDFLGLQGKEDLLQEYARCAAVVLASRQETAPMTVIEAMAAGKPVVSTRAGGVPDLVEDGRSGFIVEVGDVTSLARRISELLADRDLRRSMGEHARQRAERFRLETVAAAYRQLLYQVAGRPLP